MLTLDNCLIDTVDLYAKHNAKAAGVTSAFKSNFINNSKVSTINLSQAKVNTGFAILLSSDYSSGDNKTVVEKFEFNGLTNNDGKATKFHLYLQQGINEPELDVSNNGVNILYNKYIGTGFDSYTREGNQVTLTPAVE